MGILRIVPAGQKVTPEEWLKRYRRHCDQGGDRRYGNPSYLDLVREDGIPEDWEFAFRGLTEPRCNSVIPCHTCSLAEGCARRARRIARWSSSSGSIGRGRFSAAYWGIKQEVLAARALL